MWAMLQCYTLGDREIEHKYVHVFLIFGQFMTGNEKVTPCFASGKKRRGSSGGVRERGDPKSCFQLSPS